MQPLITKWLYGLAALLLLFATLHTTAFAKTITETKTFNRHLTDCRFGEIIAKGESKRACDRVLGKLEVKSIKCKCRKKGKCKTVLVAACTYHTRNMQPLYKNKASETFGIKDGKHKSTGDSNTTSKAKNTRHSTSKGIDNYISVGPLDRSKKISCRKATNQSHQLAKTACSEVGGVYRDKGNQCKCTPKGDQWQCNSIRKVKCL